MCIRSHAEHIIRDGTIEKLVCPGFDEHTNQACICSISEQDLRACGLSDELILKLDEFSVNKAIDKMDDFGWCPDPKC